MSIDLNDPLLEPIEGTTLEKYVEVMIALSKSGKTNWDEIIPFVESQGIKSGTWQAVQAGWNGRLGSNQQLQIYYGI